MNDPLKKLPFNTLQQFVQGECKSGCKLIVPVEVRDNKEQVTKSNELQKYITEEGL